jgi:hypothetical protein
MPPIGLGAAVKASRGIYPPVAHSDVGRHRFKAVALRDVRDRFVGHVERCLGDPTERLSPASVARRRTGSLYTDSTSKSSFTANAPEALAVVVPPNLYDRCRPCRIRDYYRTQPPALPRPPQTIPAMSGRRHQDRRSKGPARGRGPRPPGGTDAQLLPQLPRRDCPRCALTKLIGDLHVRQVLGYQLDDFNLALSHAGRVDSCGGSRAV